MERASGQVLPANVAINFGMPTRSTPGTTSAILPLSTEVVAQIKSSTTITSLNNAILALVENSLDAQADRVTIEVDFIRGCCTVEDNGLGIAPAEFLEGGGLGKLYHTSKYAKLTSFYGCNGTFLASLASLCLLTITSKQHQHRSTNSVTIHRGKSISRLVPAPAAHHVEHRDHGTRVTVRDLFGNLPVRVTQRSLILQDQGEQDKLWEELKSMLVALLIAFASPISLRLKDTVRGKQMSLVERRPQHASNNSDKRGSMLSSKHFLTLSLLHQTGQISLDDFDSWIPASASSQALVIKGLISLDPSPSKSYQYISLGNAPLLKSGHSLLYDHINRIFSNSRFGALEAETVSEEEILRRGKDRRFKQDGLTRKQMVVEKGVDRSPMFVLRVQFKEPVNSSNDMLRSEANLTNVIQVLEALVTGWLEAHDFEPRKRPSNSLKLAGVALSEDGLDRKQRKSRSSSRSRTSLILASRGASMESHSTQLRPRPYTGVATLNELGRRKSSRCGDQNRSESLRPILEPTVRKAVDIESSVDKTTLLAPLSRTRSLQSQKSKRLVPREWDESGNLAADFQQLNRQLETNDSEPNLSKGRSLVDSTIDWIDPVTKVNHKINARTGALIAGQCSKPSALDTNVPFCSPKGRIPLGIRNKTADGRKSTGWLDGVLQNWDNPIFRAPEQGITRASFDLPLANGIRVQGFAEIERAFVEVSQLNANKISRRALREAKVIAQVDDKFILLRLEVGLLVVVDQHAADERCKVEELLQDLCSKAEIDDVEYTSKTGLASAIKTTILTQPIKFTVPAKEAELFKQHAGSFANCGILYDLEGSSEREHTLEVKTLPPAIAERCRLDSKLLISVLRSEIWKAADSGRPAARQHPRIVDSSVHGADYGDWIKQISRCPKAILDIINSRACRSAIMFNDRLSKGQCEDLVKRLAECKFPFQCAHGRPSMVPLIDLGAANTAGMGGSAEDDDGGEDFATAYRKWRGMA